MEDPRTEKTAAKKRIRELRTTIGESLQAGNRPAVRKLRQQVKRLKRRSRELAAAAKATPETPAAPATEPGSAEPAKT